MEHRFDTNKLSPQDTLVKSHFAPVSESVLHYEVQRIKKLVTALYMVTDLLDSREPLRVHIRTYSLDLLRESHISQSITASQLEVHMAAIMAAIEALISFVEIAGVARVVSTSNTELLVRELRALHMHMLNRYTTLIGAQADAAEDESDIDISSLLGSFGSSKQETPIKPASPLVSAPQQDPAPQKKPATPIYHEHKLDYQKKMKKEAAAKKEAIDPAEEKLNRKERILAIVREKGEASLKDIVIRIASCSEKTLQRDVRELVADGVLVKEGSKRWSVYRLAN